MKKKKKYFNAWNCWHIYGIKRKIKDTEVHINVGPKKTVSPQKLLVQKNIDIPPKKVGLENFGSKKDFGPKNSGLKKYLIWKNIKSKKNWDQKFVGPKKCSFQTNLGHTKFCSNKYWLYTNFLGSKKIGGPNICKTQNSLDPK